MTSLLANNIKISNIINFGGFFFRRSLSTGIRKTLSFQKKLSRLPLPSLEETLPKYLLTVQPHLNGDEFNVTKRKINDFLNGVGPKFQSLLQERWKTRENWFADWWLDMAYLSYRDPVVVWSSPGIIWPKQNFSAVEDQLKFASKVIAGAMDFKLLVDNQELPVEMMGPDTPLDMRQYYIIFGTTRIPGLTVDRQSFNPNSKHIVVIHNNNFFKLGVYGEDGGVLSEGQIRAGLEDIVHHHRKIPKGKPVGVLTTDNRDNWGKAFQILVEDNADTLGEIEKALFTLSLDSDEYADYPDNRYLNKCAYQSVTGLGPKAFAANRWYDKTIQFFVGQDGTCGMTYEHSPAEGPPLMRITDHVLQYIDSGSNERSNVSGIEPPLMLEFIVNDQVEHSIKVAEENLDKLHNDLDFDVLDYNNYGKEFIKSQKFSPDSYIQVCLQLAFYRIHGVPGAHYESGAVRQFLHGRTEVIRTCSNETVDFAKKMLNSNLNSDEKYQAMKAAILGHNQYAKMAVSGYGVDRHLQGLKKIALENGFEIPELFNDPGYIRSSRMRISTSQVAGTTKSALCFGPLVMDGYGCCYNPRSEDILMTPSAMKSCPETSATQFKDALTESFDEMQSLCLKH